MTKFPKGPGLHLSCINCEWSEMSMVFMKRLNEFNYYYEGWSNILSCTCMESDHFAHRFNIDHPVCEIFKHQEDKDVE